MNPNAALPIAEVSTELDQLCLNTIRTLSIDTVQQANSGHPGMPMGAATLAYVLWTRHLRHNPKNPAWPDRDRFVLSAGHASALLYSLLYLTGYDLAMDDLGQFRQVILIATGSEVSLALDAHARLASDGIRSRVVSMPCWALFDAQPQSYRDTVLPPSVRARVSIEAAAPFGWECYVGPAGAIIGVTGFGASAPGPVVMREFGFTPGHVVDTAKALLKRSRGDSREKSG